MKKIIVLAVIIFLMVCLSGCGWNETKKENREANDGRMMVVYNDGRSIIYVDTETGCQYFSRANCGSCLMVDENGNPLIYEKVGEGV